jgi:hypothetical protein
MNRFKLINRILWIAQIAVVVILAIMLVKAMNILFILISGEITP